jgi:hypothetical protein
MNEVRKSWDRENAVRRYDEYGGCYDEENDDDDISDWIWWI